VWRPLCVADKGGGVVDKGAWNMSNANPLDKESICQLCDTRESQKVLKAGPNAHT